MKNLLIAPHIDDEVLYCSSLLNSNFFVYFCGVNKQFIDIRLSELKLVSAFFNNFQYEVDKTKDSNNYAEYGLHFWVNKFQSLINKIQPEQIFLPL